MVPVEIFDFLKDLEVNNNREWFQVNKERYQNAKAAFEITTLKMISLVSEVDSNIGIVEPKDCIFRIYRDTRFSKNNLPYKNNFGAYVNRGGRKSPFAGYYLHVQPSNSFVACGIHMPDSQVLKAVREDIYHFPDEFKKIVQNQQLQNVFGSVVGEKLKVGPKGFNKDFKDIELIKYKSYNLVKYLQDDDLVNSNFEKKVSKYLTLMLPFNNFFNTVIEDLA